MGLGINQMYIKIRQGFQELKVQSLAKAYLRAHSKLIVIDQEGTLPTKYLARDSEPPGKVV